VVLLEPTPSFINEAIKLSSAWRGIPDASKSVTFVQGTLQDYDPRTPIPVLPSSLTAASTPPNMVKIPSNSTTGKILNLGRVGYTGRLSSLEQSSVTEEEGENEEGFDVIWCQWCLGHLSDTELVAFFKACKEALRSQIDEEDVRTRSLIIVKENVCFDGENGAIRSEFDERDSSVTR
jgi:protein N-terminal methyltransferase